MRFAPLEWGRAIPSCFAFARGDTCGAQFCSAEKQAREQAAALVARMAGVLRAGGLRASTAVVEGDPLLAILGRAAEWGADLIVLGSHGHSAGSSSAAYRRKLPIGLLFLSKSSVCIGLRPNRDIPTIETIDGDPRTVDRNHFGSPARQSGRGSGWVKLNDQSSGVD